MDDDEFAFVLGVLAHDLGAVMRQVHGLAGLIDAGGDEKLLGMLRSSAGRGGAMVSRLSDYRSALTLEEASVMGSVEALERKIERRSAIVCNWDAIECLAGRPLDGKALELILCELVDNAERFGASRVDIRVDVSGDEVQAVGVYDDGEGVEPRFREDVFAFGRRLRAVHEHEGAGVGLAIVKLLCVARGWRVDMIDSALGGVGVRVVFSGD